MFDVIVIGAGITGTCIARELSKYQLKSIVLEKESDVGQDVTNANSAIVHSGHDPIPGTLKAKFNILGNAMYEEMSKDLDIPFLKTGALVIAKTSEQFKTLKTLQKRGYENGLKKDQAVLLSQAETLALEPNLVNTIKGSLSLPTTAITYPLEAAIANMENAMDNGVKLALNTEVIDICQSEGPFKVMTNHGAYDAKVVINAAGLYAHNISKMIAETNFDLTPRRGEYYVLDKDIKVVDHVIYPVPDEKGKGVLVTPQYHGNTLIGPTSEFVDIKEKAKTTPEGLAYIKKHINETLKTPRYDKIIRSFAGSRPTPDTHDFIIEESNVKGFINVAGIESPGLTGAPAIAQYVVNDLVSKRLDLAVNPTFNKKRRPVVRMAEYDIDKKNAYVKKNPQYGRIICRCESITEAEVVDAIHRNCGAKTVAGVKNRVRAGAGRCQGGFCQPVIVDILARELGKKHTDIEYKKQHSNLLKGRTKGEKI